MEFAVTLAVWMTIVAVPCAISLFIGDWIGSRRFQRVMASVNQDTIIGAAGVEMGDAFLVESWKLKGRVAPRAVEMPDPRRPRDPHRAQRRKTFAMMPPLDELRAEADAIRFAQQPEPRSGWAEPADSAVRIEYMPKGEPVEEPTLPQLTAAAPLELSTKAADLERQRLALTARFTCDQPSASESLMRV